MVTIVGCLISQTVNGYTVELLINETVNGETIRFVISQFVINKISVLRKTLQSFKIRLSLQRYPVIMLASCT